MTDYERLVLVPNIKLLPLRRLTLIEDAAPSGWYPTTPAGTFISSTQSLELPLLESESSLSMEPVTRATDRGDLRQIALRVAGTFLVPESEAFPTYSDLLDAYFTKKRISAIVQFGDEDWSSNSNYQMSLYLTNIDANPSLPAPAVDARCEITYSIESVEQRLRMKINLSSILVGGGALNAVMNPNQTSWI